MAYKRVAIKLCIFIIIGMLAFMSISVFAQSEEGLVAEWHFDEGYGSIIKDSSGNGNDGTIYGATWVDGKFGKALSFDGVDDYADLFPSNRLGISNELTVEMWVNPINKLGSGLIGPFGETAFMHHQLDPKGYFAGYLYGPDIYVYSNTPVSLNSWTYIVLTYKSGIGAKTYINGNLDWSGVGSGALSNTVGNLRIGSVWDDTRYFHGIIDEVRIYNRALSAEEIKAQYEQGQTMLTVKKEISPYSIRQYQITNVTIQIKNSGTLDIRDIEIVDSTNPNLDLVGGEFPNPKKYNSLVPGESREIQYILKSKESGTLILEPVTVSYADDKGNIKVVKSEPISLTVVPSSEGAPEGYSPSELGSSSAVLLHGEKTDVVLGEDILLKLSAVNLITKPPMTVQVILYPPSGMSVTGSEFVESGAGIYTTTYTLDPGKGKDIEVHIKSNQAGDFSVNGRIVYYFGDDKKSAEDHTLTLPITVRKEPGQIASSPSSSNNGMAAQKVPGFAGGIAIIGILLMVLLIKRGMYK